MLLVDKIRISYGLPAAGASRASVPARSLPSCLLETAVATDQMSSLDKLS